MGNPTGFKEFARDTQIYREVSSRILDYKELYSEAKNPILKDQASRCMDCGVPLEHPEPSQMPPGLLLDPFFIKDMFVHLFSSFWIG